MTAIRPGHPPERFAPNLALPRVQWAGHPGRERRLCASAGGLEAQTGGFRTRKEWPRTPCLTALLFLGGLLSILVSAVSVQAGDRCPGAETTVAILECLDRRLTESDRALARNLEGVATSAAQVPGEPFGPIWRDFNNQYSGGTDPGRQLRTFQRQRRQICRYANSMALQGSGFGVFVLSCELDLSEALLQQFRN